MRINNYRELCVRVCVYIVNCIHETVILLPNNDVREEWEQKCEGPMGVACLGGRPRFMTLQLLHH